VIEYSFIRNLGWIDRGSVSSSGKSPL